MAVTASAYLVAWGPFSVLCIWEMVVQPKVLLNHGHDGDGDGYDGLVWIVSKSKGKIQHLEDKTIFQAIPAEYRLVAGLFAKSAAAVNPFIYFFMSAGFRRDTGNILHRY